MKRVHLIFFLSIVLIGYIYPQAKTDKEYTKLTKCVSRNNKEKAQKYLERGFKIDARDNMGKTPLLYCLQQNKTDFAMFFIDHGANINVTDYHGNTSLHYAIENCTTDEMTFFLIEKGVDINKANNEMYTPFHYSVLFSCDILPYFLIDKGADYKKITALNENALHLSIESGCDSMSNFLIQHGLDINLIDNQGNNPLLKAIIARNSYMTEKLMDLGCDINLRNNSGKSSIYYAVSNNDTKLVKDLLDRDVNIVQEPGDESYVYISAEFENDEITEALLRRGVENPMQCDIHETCYKTAYVYSINARIVPDDQKLKYYQNSLNIYKVAEEKYKQELNKIRAKNTAKFCGEVCLMSAAVASSPSYYTPYYGPGFDYEDDRRAYLKNRIDICKDRIQKLENTINCINSAKDKTNLTECF